jgi:Ser/Thr protein kinase RdoA (MazF antagonist)
VDSPAIDDSLKKAVAAYGLDPAGVRPVHGGLINRTWRVRLPSGGDGALQQVNPIFPPAVNADIAAVTAHLAARGVATPRLIPTAAGQPWHESDGAAWRLMDWIPGRALQSLAAPPEAAAAGRGLGRFHAALADFEQSFRNTRPGVHDTARHLAALHTSLENHATHPDIDRIRPLGEAIIAAAEAMPALAALPTRVVHGDPKINNFIFHASENRVLALVDLDTVSRMPIHLELGDAFRSWCNPAGEDAASADFRIDLLAAGLSGYAETRGAGLTDAERQAIVPGIGLIIIELAARFCADALNERYFGWDPRRFASRGEHNRVRAAGQLALFRAFSAARGEAEAAAEAAFAGG